jgi:hypothetical protein
MKRILYPALVVLGLAAVPDAFADPGDFGAMPGLWKIQLRHTVNGKAAPEEVQWHCLDEGADPWTTFATWIPMHDECTAGDRHRGSTSLAWTLTCKRGAATARVDFDNAKHYTGSISAADGSKTGEIAGNRYAACTSPED